MIQRVITIDDIKIGNEFPFTLIAGPCQMETEEHAIMISSKLAESCEKNKINFIFKASFDKANRTSISGIRGVGLNAGLKILSAVKSKVGCPTFRYSYVDQCKEVANVGYYTNSCFSLSTNRYYSIACRLGEP